MTCAVKSDYCEERCPESTSVSLLDMTVPTHGSRRLESDPYAVVSHDFFVPCYVMYVPQHVAVSLFGPLN